MHLFKPATRSSGRIPRLFLTFLLLLASWGVKPAHADGVTGTISNGQTINGAVAGSGFDNYTFKAAAGSYFVVSASETGTHDETFAPEIILVAPGSGDVRGNGHALYARVEEKNAAEGTWSVKVRRPGGGTTGGNYTLSFIQVPGVFVAGGIAAVPMSVGVNNHGTNSRGKVDVWTFNGVAGHTTTLTLNQTGANGFVPEMTVVSPTGDFAGGASCGTSCTQDVSIVASGTYTVLLWKNDGNDVAGAYTLSVNDKN